MAWLLFRMDRGQEAVAAYDAAVAMRPEESDMLSGRGDLYFTLGQYDQAIRDYDAALQHKPDDRAIIFARGNAHAQLGQDEQADADYSAIRTHEAKTADDLVWRGDAALNLRDFQAAVGDFVAAWKLDQKNTPACLAVGHANLMRGALDNAVNWFTTCVGLRPNDPEGHYLLGIARMLRDAPGDARAADTQLSGAIALSLSPDADAWLWRAFAAGRLAHSETAMRDVLDSSWRVDVGWPVPVLRFMRGQITEAAM
jgi:tetratricopeptide (TPR) repeat protein